jgi:hypothetical protein
MQNCSSAYLYLKVFRCQTGSQKMMRVRGKELIIAYIDYFAHEGSEEKC